MTGSWWLVGVALFVLMTVGTGAGFRVCEEAQQKQVGGPGGNQAQLVYNPHRHEYFAAYLLLEGEQSSIMGQRYDERGSPVGQPVPVYTYQDSYHRKQSPAVSYNNVSDYYLVVWEFDWRDDGSDWDVMGRVVKSDGSPPQAPAFFVGYSFGRDDSPHLSFSPKDNAFVLVHEVEDTLTETRGIVAVRLNDTHVIGEPQILNTSHTDREPFIAYHPPSNNFLVVWEWDNDKDNKSVIGSALIGGNPLQIRGDKYVVGSTVEIIGGKATLAHDHDAQLAYSSQDDHFFLVWEVDGDSGEKEVVCSRVNPDATPKNGFQVLGNSRHPYDRRPSVVYTPFSNDFLVVFETGHDPIATSVEGVAVKSHDLTRASAPFSVSKNLDREHDPSIAISSTCGSVMALWASDTSLPAARSEAGIGSSQASFKSNDQNAAITSSAVTVKDYTPRNKFGSGRRSTNSVDNRHVFVSPEVIEMTRRVTPTRRVPSDTSSLVTNQICLPGRGYCTAAGTPLPPPSPPHGGSDDGGSVVGIVLGILGAVVGLAVLGALGFLVWKRLPQIREWIESRRSRGFEGVWADENEFSISVDAFTGSGDDAGEAAAGDTSS